MTVAPRHSGPASVTGAPPAVIDLHAHSLRSDGVLSPTELVRAAADCGVRLLALTDHDTLAGVRDLQVAGLPEGFELIPGVEINAVSRTGGAIEESEIHVLGLGVDPADEGLEQSLAAQRTARRDRFARMLQRLRELGLPVDRELERLPPTDDEDALGRPRVARALIAAGHATSVEDAFARWLSRGQPAYVPRDGLDALGAIRAIRLAGGLAVLAHFAQAAERIELLRELRDAGLGGLEVHHASFGPATSAAVGEVARQLTLVATGGSDYHGDGVSYSEVHAGLSIPGSIEAPLRAALAASRERPDMARTTDR